MSNSAAETLRSQTLMINPHVHVTFCSNSEVLIKHGSRSRFSQVLRDEGRTHLLGKVLRNLRAPTSLAELQERQIVRDHELEDALKLIEHLRAEKILISPEDYLPHVYLSMQFGAAAAGLRACRLGLIGSGFLGSRLARDLARLQVRELVLLDDRRVQPRDRSYFDVSPALVEPGASFASITERALNDEGFTSVRTIEAALDDQRALTDLFDQVDVAVAALEWFSPQTLHGANAVSQALGKPWMSVYVDGSEALIGPIYVPGETPCYNELEIQHEAAISLKDDYLLYKESLIDDQVEPHHFVLPPYLNLLSGWTMTALLPFMISGRSFAVGRAVRIDFERVFVDYEDVLKLPRCPGCSAQRPAYRHTFL